MLSTLSILLPIFGLVLAGFLCAKRGVLGPAAASELNKFVVWLGLPALLFNIMAHSTWRELDQPGFAAVFSLASAVPFVLTIVIRLMGRRRLADASIEAIAASYPNVGYIGFPLCLLLFGQSSLTPTTIATILVACVLFGVTIALIEVGLQTEHAPHKLAANVLWALARNPLIVSPVAGALIAATHVAMPASFETFLKLLGGAASPCALVSLGAFLAKKRAAEGGEKSGVLRDAVLLTMAKLIAQPLLTWWLAIHVFMLQTSLANVSVVLAALPTGTGPFMLAEYYKREAEVASRVILLSTVGAVITLTVVLMFVIQRG